MLDARDKLAAVLALMDEPVHLSTPDAVVPPCVMLGWRTPMIEWGVRSTTCIAFGHLSVTLVGGRLEMADGMAAIEKMYDAVQRSLRADSEGWSFLPDSGIVALTIGGALYQACRAEVRVPLLL